MKKQIQNMIKYRYLPFTFGKKKYKKTANVNNNLDDIHVPLDSNYSEHSNYNASDSHLIVFSSDLENSLQLPSNNNQFDTNKQISKNISMVKDTLMKQTRKRPSDINENNENIKWI
ncbi:protein rer1 [Anaeramoeba flamelloides]|nr:protein rer1 [Anaeramoeba flamelloides]